MDSRNLKSLMEAYASVYSPQEVEQVDENRAAMGRINKEYHRKKESEAMAARARDPKVKRDLPKRKNDNPMYDPKSAGSSRVKGFKFTGEEVESEAYEPMTKERQMKVDRAKKKAYDADHRAQYKGDSAEADKQFKRRMAMDSRTKMRKEELDIFDTILEFLYVEGYVDTLEEAKWMMANLIDEEAIDIILGEDSRRMSNKQHTARVRSNIKSFGSNYTPPSNFDPDANRGKGEVLTRKQIEKKRRKALRQEEFEAWLDEAMSSYDRNRKRAAQRAAARNAARDAGKTGVVPGVGYVSPRRERETYTDEKGTVRHKSGAKMP